MSTVLVRFWPCIVTSGMSFSPTQCVLYCLQFGTQLKTTWAALPFNLSFSMQGGCAVPLLLEKHAQGYIFKAPTGELVLKFPFILMGVTRLKANAVLTFWETNQPTALRQVVGE